MYFQMLILIALIGYLETSLRWSLVRLCKLYSIWKIASKIECDPIFCKQFSHLLNNRYWWRIHFVIKNNTMETLLLQENFLPILLLELFTFLGNFVYYLHANLRNIACNKLPTWQSNSAIKLPVWHGHKRELIIFSD